VSSSGSSPSRRPRLLETLVPLLIGAAVIIVGALVAQANNWSTGAIWTLGVAGALIAGLGYAIPAARRAPRLPKRADDANSGVLQERPSVAIRQQSEPDPSAVSAEPTNALTLGMPVEPAQKDEFGLAPDRVLVLSGHSSSGKTGIAEHLAREHPDWAWASCGAFVKGEAKKRGLPPTLPATNALGQQLVDELGGEKFLTEVLEHSKVPPSATTLIVDDVYHVAVFDAIKRRWGHLRFVTVSLPESMRRQLWREQGRSDEEVAALEQNPLDQAATELVAHRQPEVKIDGARNEQEIVERTREIDELVAA
jgi:hypothetical protein